jgi:hypothetical protein
MNLFLTNAAQNAAKKWKKWPIAINTFVTYVQE